MTDKAGSRARGTTAGTPVEVEVEVRRSARRRRTVSAYREGSRVIVQIPARFTRAEQERWVATMLARLEAGAERQRRAASDTALTTRAQELSRRYLGGRARPSSVRWVTNMNSRWASCTPADATIRVSARLQQVPTWVRDYVLVHELAHLLVADHSARFWSLVQRYPRSERARGYLDGLSAAAGLRFGDDDLAGDLATDSAEEAAG